METYLTIEEIIEKYGINDRAIRYRTELLNIKPLKAGKKFIYNESQVWEIRCYKPKNMLNNRRKITIIEYWFDSNSYTKTAFRLNITREYVTLAVKEWLDNSGYITIESKMNNA